jgi:hypothetical protein
VVKLLFDAGADPDAEDKEALMLLTQAASHVQKCGREYTDTALVWAIRLGKDLELELLLKTWFHGAGAN